jgi:hypothetical protein
MSNTLNTQVSERYIETNAYGTVRVSLVKLPANWGGHFESAVFLPNGDSYVWMQNHVLDYAVDGFEHLVAHAEEFIEFERDWASKELAEYLTA